MDNRAVASGGPPGRHGVACEHDRRPLPPSNQRNVDEVAQFFAKKGLSLDDMVILSG
jgi:hypothetical protein